MVHYSDEKMASLAMRLQQMTSRLLIQDFKVKADLSKALFFDIARPWGNDIELISDQDSDGIRPAKYVAYLAFWYRKIKPISFAYNFSDIEAARANGFPPAPALEIVDINERLAIKVAFELLSDYVKAGKAIVHDGSNEDGYVVHYDPEGYRAAVMNFCSRKLGVDGDTVSGVLIRDMRYRSFGAHHLVHLFDQFVFSLLGKTSPCRPEG